MENNNDYLRYQNELENADSNSTNNQNCMTQSQTWNDEGQPNNNSAYNPYAFSSEQPTYIPPTGNKKKPSNSNKLPTILLMVACLIIAVMAGAVINEFLFSDSNGNNQSAVASPTPTKAVSERVNDGSNPSKGITYTTGEAENNSALDVVAKCMESVVSINTTVVTQSFYGETTSTGAGSGVIITQDGYIATCNHVIEGASEVVATLKDGTSYKATLVGYDSRTDLAVLKIDATGLTPASVGSSGSYAIGEEVYAIGNPLGELSCSVSKGIISGKDRKVEIDGQTLSLIQTDAAVNPGNSGGALFSAQTGELIGIVNAKSYGAEIDGLGFAIPTDSAFEIITDIMDLGYVSGRPYLGISMQDVTINNNGGYSIFGNMFGNTETAVLVVSVAEGSPAESGGILTGDYIIGVDEAKITSIADFQAAINDKNAGDVISLTVKRNNQNMTISITLGESSSSN